MAISSPVEVALKNKRIVYLLSLTVTEVSLIGEHPTNLQFLICLVRQPSVIKGILKCVLHLK